MFIRSASIGLFLLLAACGLGRAMPYCMSEPPTIRQQVGDADLIVCGTLSDANMTGDGTTELKVEAVLKDGGFLKGRKAISLPRYGRFDPNKPNKYIVFCQVFKGTIDPYRGETF